MVKLCLYLEISLGDSKAPRLTLMEEVLLMGLKDKEGIVLYLNLEKSTIIYKIMSDYL